MHVSMRARKLRLVTGVLLALAGVLALSAPAVAVASTYNRADIVRWSPKGHVSAKKGTKVRIRFLSDDTGKSYTAWFWADRRTKFYSSQTRTSDIAVGYERVSRNTFFDRVKAGGYVNVASNVKWKWRRDSHHKRYRYLVRIRVSTATAG